MAAARVFIDDAVNGTLPDICVKTGEPAYGNRLWLTQEVGASTRLGVLWLLVLAGPLGWLVLVVVSIRRGGERLTVQLPMSKAAQERVEEARSARNLAAGLAVGGGCLVLLWVSGVIWPPGVSDFGVYVLIALAVALVVLSLVFQVGMNRVLVDIELDASRRWLTIRGAHPAFAAAYENWEPEPRRAGSDI